MRPISNREKYSRSPVFVVGVFEVFGCASGRRTAVRPSRLHPDRRRATLGPMDSLEGQLLVAAPRLLDPNFAKVLVLLLEHNDDGAFGLIINRPVDKTVQELSREVGSAAVPQPAADLLGRTGARPVAGAARPRRSGRNGVDSRRFFRRQEAAPRPARSRRKAVV